jgi:hypothetical protein
MIGELDSIAGVTRQLELNPTEIIVSEVQAVCGPQVLPFLRPPFVKRCGSRVVGYLEISAPVFCLVMFHGGSCYFASAASGSYAQMGQIEV